MNWADKEMYDVSFGDTRLNKRAGNLLEQLGKQPKLSIPAACKGWTETMAAYRFFSNDKVTSRKILEPHINKTIERAKEYPVVLFVQDTTELDFSSKPETKGLGYLRHKTQHGMYLHPILAITPDRINLGTVDAKLWARDNETYGKSRNYAKLKIENKESFRWIEGYRKICDIQKKMPNTKTVYVADRESDIYDLFLDQRKVRKKHRPEIIVRASYNRNVNKNEKLFSKLKLAPTLGTINFDISATKTRKARRVTQTLQAVHVSLNGPKRRTYSLPNTKMTAILALEQDPPPGEKPLKWIFLTSMSVNTSKDASMILDYYLCRWEIEVFFKVLKSGCTAEELQLETAENLKNAISFYLIIAWRVMFLMKLSREHPNILCNIVLTDEEWVTLHIVTKKTKPPKRPPTLGNTIKEIAAFGGYLNRKCDGPPGPKTVWIGLQRLRDFVFARNAQLEMQNGTYV